MNKLTISNEAGQCTELIHWCPVRTGFYPTFVGITRKTILLMNRRNFLRAGSLTGFSFSALGFESFFSPAARRTTDVSPDADFPLLETTIDQLQLKMGSGEYSSVAITRLYLKRIEAVDKKGPALNAGIEINPDALTIAAAMD